jgi:DNA polymerase-3 subunit gamma/tau
MYQVIARKYRPQNFDELIGQEHVQKTLANAIASNRIAHGYIFSGQRGTGKTTVARILARCLNCVQGPTATPCGVCSSCLEIAAGNSVDVIEIDAASNRGINEMREIRENVRYRPARDRYKIFIVDEAHQITKDAFNALLKTLEEPPEWVVFILCTTEAYEIPNTIASRCQHFSFRSVDFSEVMRRMRFIVEQEGIQASDEVLSVVAHAGEGSVRDSLSALDQAIACCGTTLRVEDVRALLGVFALDSLAAVSSAVQNEDTARMLDLVHELERNGQSLQHFTRELARYWRNLLVSKIAGPASSLIAASAQEQQRLLEAAAGFSEEELTRYLSLTLDLYKTLQSSLQPRLHLELGLIKLIHVGRLQSIEDALANLDKSLPVQLSASSRISAPRPPALQVPAKPAAVPPAATAPAITPAPAPAITPAATGDFARDLYQALCREGLNYSADAIQQSELTLQAAELTIRGAKSLSFSLKDPAVQRLASEVAGKPIRVRFEIDETRRAVPQSPPAAANGDDSELRQRALSDPAVKRFQELFTDAQVRTVRNLSE